MSDGGMERVKVPKISRSSGIEDVYDADVWETVPVIDGGMPLEGRFIAVYPSIGLVVRETGFILMQFPTRTQISGRITKVVRLGGDRRIIKCITHFIGARCYLVCLGLGNVMAFEISADGLFVFERQITDNTGDLILAPSMHVIDFGVSITSVLFTDRTKDIESVEGVISGARSLFGFPQIRSVPLPVYGGSGKVASTVHEAPTIREATSSSTTSASGSGKKNLFKRIFRRDELGLSDKSRSTKSVDEKFKPTEEHLKQARDQLAKNLEKMAKLQNDTADMEMASQEFLHSVNKLSGKYKQRRKFLGIKF
jgi:hypothetical protein